MIQIKLIYAIVFIFSCMFMLCVLIFWDFKSKCPFCKSRFSEPFCRLEIYKQSIEEAIKTYVIKIKMRKCLRCRHKRIIRKESKTYMLKQGEEMTVRL